MNYREEETGQKEMRKKIAIWISFELTTRRIVNII